MSAGNFPSGSWFATGTIDPRKFTDYLLSPTHPEGRHKLRLWSAVFGIGEGDAVLLESLIREQIPAGIVTERKPSVDLRRFEVLILDFTTQAIAPSIGMTNAAPIITAWVAQHGDYRDVCPRFVTAYPDVP